ncbi:hypothetical protein ACJX0J_017076, partial [Zea mays]
EGDTSLVTHFSKLKHSRWQKVHVSMQAEDNEVEVANEDKQAQPEYLPARSIRPRALTLFSFSLEGGLFWRY